MAKRVTVFAGHYGSGKTNIAVNFALMLAKDGAQPVTLYDLDIVNPYFRTADSAAELAASDVALVSPAYANTNAEAAPIPAAVMSAFDHPVGYAVFDVGGDDAGAVALGRYSRQLRDAGADLLMVINKLRPLSGDAAAVLDIMRDMERAAGLRFTGIVNNTNLAGETTPGIIMDSLPYAEEISRMTGLPVVFTSVRRDIARLLKGKVDNLFPVDIYRKPGWAVF